MKKNLKYIVVYILWNYGLFLIAFLVFAIFLFFMYQTFQEWLNTKVVVSGVGAYIIARKVISKSKKFHSFLNGQ